MILISIKNNTDNNIVDNLLNDYFREKNKPPHKFINKFEKFNSWTPLLIDAREYELEEELIEFLSKKLGLTVFGYEDQDIVTSYTLYLYNSGECVDEFYTVDFEIISTYGHFSYIDDLSEEEKTNLDTDEILKNYYNQLGFDPNYVSFEDEY